MENWLRKITTQNSATNWTGPECPAGDQRWVADLPLCCCSRSRAGCAVAKLAGPTGCGLMIVPMCLLRRLARCANARSGHQHSAESASIVLVGLAASANAILIVTKSAISFRGKATVSFRPSSRLRGFIQANPDSVVRVHPRHCCHGDLDETRRRDAAGDGLRRYSSGMRGVALVPD